MAHHESRSEILNILAELLSTADDATLCNVTADLLGCNVRRSIRGFEITDEDRPTPSLANPMPQPCIIATGNAFEGLTVWGPFPNPEAALAWVHMNDKTDLYDAEWVMVQLEEIH